MRDMETFSNSVKANRIARVEHERTFNEKLTVYRIKLRMRYVSIMNCSHEFIYDIYTVGNRRHELSVTKWHNDRELRPQIAGLS